MRHARKWRTCRAIAQDAPSQHDSGTLEGAFEIPALHSLFEVRTCTMRAAVAVWSAELGRLPEQVLQRRCILCVASLFLRIGLHWCDCLAVEPIHLCLHNCWRTDCRVGRATELLVSNHLWYACCGVARSAIWLPRSPKHWLPGSLCFERRHRLLTQTCLHLMPLFVTSWFTWMQHN